jgi:hypothetical protein
MIAIPKKSNEVVKCTVEANPVACASWEKEYVYLTLETDADKTIMLALAGIEAVDDMIDRLIAVRNRVWPFPVYQVQP